MKLKNGEWVDVGGSFDSPYAIATEMLVYHDKLYVFGIFETIGGGVPAQNIAVWDGTKWCGTGSVFDDSKIGSAIEWNGDLIVAGNFDEIDGMEISEIARWTGGDYLDSCGMPVAAHEKVQKEKDRYIIAPNPATETITITTPKSNPYTLRIYNASGQMVAQRPEVITASHRLDISEFPPGIYWFQFLEENSVFVKKLIIQ